MAFFVTLNECTIINKISEKDVNFNIIDMQISDFCKPSVTIRNWDGNKL